MELIKEFLEWLPQDPIGLILAILAMVVGALLIAIVKELAPSFYGGVEVIVGAVTIFVAQYGSWQSSHVSFGDRLVVICMGSICSQVRYEYGFSPCFRRVERAQSAERRPITRKPEGIPRTKRAVTTERPCLNRARGLYPARRAPDAPPS